MADAATGRNHGLSNRIRTTAACRRRVRNLERRFGERRRRGWRGRPENNIGEIRERGRFGRLLYLDPGRWRIRWLCFSLARVPISPRKAVKGVFSRRQSRTERLENLLRIQADSRGIAPDSRAAIQAGGQLRELSLLDVLGGFEPDPGPPGQLLDGPALLLPRSPQRFVGHLILLSTVCLSVGAVHFSTHPLKKSEPAHRKPGNRRLEGPVGGNRKSL